MNITFVTCFFNIYPESSQITRSEEFSLIELLTIVKSGVQLCIYTNNNCVEILLSMSKVFSNVKIMETIQLEDTFVSKVCKNIPDIQLPLNRYIEKDTIEYLQLQNNKYSFLQDTIEKNPWESTHFAWIDFNASYNFNNKQVFQKQLQILEKCSLHPKFFSISGFSDRLDISQFEYYLDNCFWRFVSSFIIGSKEELLNFCKHYQIYFSDFLQKNKKLLWDMNILAFIENNIEMTFCKPIWNKIHNFTEILSINPDFLCSSLKNILTFNYNYPSIKNYYPSSASYIYFNNKHYLNTRYVNYILSEKGKFLFPSESNQIFKSKNVLSILEFNENNLLYPTTFTLMNEKDIGLSNKENTCSQGLEDIRLYKYNGHIKFIASTSNYSLNGKINIMVGDYDENLHIYSNCYIITPPDINSWCEKNWTPIVRKNKIDGNEEELFIYKWSPFEIGRIIEDNGEKHLEIIERSILPFPWFNQFRGSTYFQEVEEGLLGLVHFSIECESRHYYHSLILLNKETLLPYKYSMPFCFIKVGIEFCLGIKIDNNSYTFWISQMDGDPLMIIVPIKEIILYDI